MSVRSLFILICSIIFSSCGKNSEHSSSPLPINRIGGATTTTVTTATAATTTTVTTTTITQSELQVTGLSDDTTPKASKTWRWGCNKGSCRYRYAINQNSSHSFNNDSN